MLHAKVDLILTTHPKAHAAGEAMGLWTWALLYSRQQELDGFVPRWSLRLAWCGEARALEHADKLVLVGLFAFDADRDGWVVLNYAAKNETRDEIAERRQLDRTRKRPAGIRTESKRTPEGFPPQGIPDSDSDSGSGSQEGVQGEESPKSGARYAEAYATGISRGKGTPYAWPGTKYAEWDLGKVIKTFAKDSAKRPYRGEQLLRWIDHTAGEFASDVVAKGTAKFYSAFDPRGCLKWLNEDQQAQEARRVG